MPFTIVSFASLLAFTSPLFAYGIGFDWRYLILVMLPGMILSGGASYLVKTRFQKYSQVPGSRGYTGQQAAQKLLDRAGITDVSVVRVDGFLSDHYNPVSKQLALSPPVFDSTSVAAIGVATHEAGHAIQHATGYAPLRWRSMIVPLVKFGSPVGTWGMVIGLGLIAASPALGKIVFIIGALAFGTLVLFQLVTLPVEFNASNRAKQLVVEAGIIGEQEREGVDKVLGAAAMTYLAAFISSLLTLLYFLYRAGFFSRR